MVRGAANERKRIRSLPWSLKGLTGLVLLVERNAAYVQNVGFELDSNKSKNKESTIEDHLEKVPEPPMRDVRSIGGVEEWMVYYAIYAVRTSALMQQSGRGGWLLLDRRAHPPGHIEPAPSYPRIHVVSPLLW